MTKLIVGSHVSVNAPNMLLGAVKDSLSYGANTFMFYTGAPQNTLRRPISTFKVEEAKKMMIENGIDINNVIVHAPYIINLANTVKKETQEIAVNFLIQELKRVQEIGCKYLVLHPGSHVGAGEEVGLKAIVDNLNIVLENDNTDVIILLETMAGKGSELGKTFDELAYIINNTKQNHRLGVCMDTCHLNDYGFDISNFDAILDEFESKIEFSRLKCIHINDSKNVREARKDRHENFGFGSLGFDNLINIIYNPRIADIPKILETPWVGDFPPYKEEIEMIRTKTFDPELKEKLLAKKSV